MIIVLYVAVLVAIGGLTGWLLTIPGQPPLWRFVLVVIFFGVLWDMAGVIWFGYRAIWPGEVVINAGFAMALVGLIVFGRPLVTSRRRRGA